MEIPTGVVGLVTLVLFATLVQGCPPGKVPTCEYTGQFFPHENDCNWFYHCSGGVAYCKQCPPLLHWNDKLKACDWPWRAGCKTSVKPASSDISAGCPVPQPYYSVYLPDPNDCSVFYECSYGVAYQQECPAGLHFNPIAHVCDYPGHAGCTAANAKVVQ